jgi:hypothetical protein
MSTYSKSKLRSYYRFPSDSFQDTVDFDGSKGHLELHRSPTLLGQRTSSASGTTNPEWRQIIRNGGNATTAFQGVEYPPSHISKFNAGYDNTSLEVSTGRTQSTHITTSGYWNVLPPEPDDPPGAVTTKVTNRAIRKFLDEAKNVQSSVEAGQDLAEIKQTIESILHPMKTLKESMVSYLSALRKRKGAFKGPKHSLRKVVADTYLEYHFGWAPLVSDVKSIIEGLTKGRLPQMTVVGSASDTYLGSWSSQFTGLDYVPFSVAQDTLLTYKYSVRFKGAVRTHCAMNGQVGILQDLQLTPKDWLPTLWDSLPWSWVVDYFVNVGEIYQGLTFMNSDLVWGCKTTRNVVRLKANDFRMVGFSPPRDDGLFKDIVHNGYAGGGAVEYESRRVSRSSFVGSDLIPRLEFRVPVSKYPFFNIAAILSQAR